MKPSCASRRASHGSSWSSEDLARASRERRAVASLDRQLEDSRQNFADAAARLRAMVHAHLQEPAWQALRNSARTARVTAQDAERLLFWFGVVVLAVILTVSAAAVLGVAVPVRRLITGTRKLASGALDYASAGGRSARDR